MKAFPLLRWPCWLVLCALWLAGPAPAQARTERLTIAAASDLKFALDAIVARFVQAHPATQVDVVYGASGKFHAQIQQGAPYDLFFSADIAYAQALAAAGWAAAPVQPYARGRLVLWRAQPGAPPMTLAQLADPAITRIAIANPTHAPYGKRAQEALRAAGVWEQVAPKLVYGESISHAAQFVQSGNAQVGLIALALARSPALARQGDFALVPEALHAPLEQGLVLTRRAAGNAAARRFAAFMGGPAAQAVLRDYGFVLPGPSP